MDNKQINTKTVQASVEMTMRAVRIGTCYNRFTQELITRNTAINLAKLNDAQKLLFVDGKATFKFEATSSSSATENSSQWGIDSKVEGGIVGTKVAVGYNMHRAHTHATENKGISACISNKYEEQYFQLQSADENVLYNCMSDDFKDKFKSIVTAKTPAEKQELYLKFIKEFGTGCVTTLYLEAGSIADISIKSDSTADSNEASYGASLAVKSKFVDASVAGSWANGYKKAGITGKANIASNSYPQNTPTKEWVNALVTKFVDKSIEELTKSASFANLPEAKFDKAPPYPEKEKVDSEKIKKNDVDFSDEMKKELLEEDDFKGSWDDYVKKQEEALKKCNAIDIVKEAREVELKGDFPYLGDKETEGPKMFKTQFCDFHERSNSLSDSPWDLGGYIPIDFVVTPWEELFPSLKAPFQFTSSSIRMAKLTSFYYTRLQFGQYLQFLTNVGDAYNSGKKKYITSDVQYYFLACEAYLQDMLAFLPEKITEDDYQKWTACFDNYLQNKNFAGKGVKVDNKPVEILFKNHEIYQAFYEHYSFFDRCCYGMVYYCPFPTSEIDSLRFDQDKGEPIAFGDVYEKKSNFESLQKSVRFYPVLEIADQADGGYSRGEVIVSLVFFEDKQFKRLAVSQIYPVFNYEAMGPHIRSESFPANLIGAFSDLKHAHCYWPHWETTEEAKKGAYKKDWSNILILNLIGNIEVNTFVATEEGMMKGVAPMFQNFPFDIAQNFPKGA